MEQAAQSRQLDDLASLKVRLLSKSISPLLHYCDAAFLVWIVPCMQHNLSAQPGIF